MNKHTDQLRDIGCRRARRLFAAASDERAGNKNLSGGRERAGLETHLKGCEDCSMKYRIHSLAGTVLDYSGTREPLAPGEDFFVSLRARLERGPQAAGAQPAFDDSWAAALLLTARQLIPAMALLLLFIIGATLIGDGQSPAGDQASARPSDRVLFNDIYDYPAPTDDDVLETLVALEENENGK